MTTAEMKGNQEYSKMKVFYSFTLRHYSSSFLFSYKFSFLQAHIFIIFWLYGSTARFCFSTFLYQTLLVRLHRFRWGPFDECLKAEDRQKRIFSFLYQEKFLKIFQTFQIWKLYLFDLFQREVLHQLEPLSETHRIEKFQQILQRPRLMIRACCAAG